MLLVICSGRGSAEVRGLYAAVANTDASTNLLFSS